jgi:hypothetical protein
MSGADRIVTILFVAFVVVVLVASEPTVVVRRQGDEVRVGCTWAPLVDDTPEPGR